jgi:putative hydrolase of the HAD superfamily
LISIDFWNTLVIAETGGQQRHQVRLNAIQEVAAKHDTTITPQAVAEAKQQAAKHFDKIWLGEQRTPSTHELVEQVMRHLDLPVSNEQLEFIAKAFEESLWEGPPQLIDGVEEALDQLASIDQLAIISDTMYSPGRVLRRYLEKQGILAYFQAFAFSDEIGVSKPHQKAFQTVLQETGGDPATSWHIGDLIPTDITGAHQQGMRSVLFTGITKADDYHGINAKREYEPTLECTSWAEITDRIVNYDS